MGIEAKHAYRFRFLKSEEWKSLRLEILARGRAKCKMCWVKDWSNDVHHIKYNKQWCKTSPGDTLVLCRTCHEKVHELFGHNMPCKNKGLLQWALRRCFVDCGYTIAPEDVRGEIKFKRFHEATDIHRFRFACHTAKLKIRKHLTGSTKRIKKRIAVDETLHELYG